MFGLSNSYSYGPDIPNPSKMAAILFQFPMLLDNMATILFKMEPYWKTEQRATIGILNALDIPAPTVSGKDFELDLNSGLKVSKNQVIFKLLMPSKNRTSVIKPSSE